ncbi:FHIPEP family type III secretion protein [Nannocystaceae bacterium ST9]
MRLAGFELAGRALLRELPGIAPALVVIALLSCVLVELPTPLVDLALSLNLAGSLLILVAAMRVRRTSELLGFPALVLLLALARLALNVSTTRLILVHADAGRVVDAFAELVVRGDLLVGVVVFAIVTAIQYLVIARGSERVAEVAARFVLDGMPGQQAAIEADLRSGAIASREAQVRRQALSERADLYGRMDGVMRWVKGDAIVGLLITGINLVGGVIVGSVRGDLSLVESLRIYGQLTIGDGLLTQVPALLVGLAAGMLVARVDRGETIERPLLWLEPAWLLAPAVLLGSLALVPGMPWLAFSTTAVGSLALALVLARRREHDHVRPELAELRVRVRSSEPEFARSLIALRRRCELAIGFELPPLRLELDDALASDVLELRRREQVLARETIVGTGHDARVLACFHALMRAAPELIEIEVVQQAIEEVRRVRPELVRQALRDVEPIDLLAILRAFVRERVPAPRLEALLRVLAERRVFAQASERAHWPEHARLALVDHWLRDLWDGVARMGTPVWIRATPDLEGELLEACEIDERGALVHWPASRRARLIERIGELAGPAPTLLLCTSRARPILARLLGQARPHVPVVAVAELAAAGIDEPTRTLSLD